MIAGPEPFSSRRPDSTPPEICMAGMLSTVTPEGGSYGRPQTFKRLELNGYLTEYGLPFVFGAVVKNVVVKFIVEITD